MMHPLHSRSRGLPDSDPAPVAANVFGKTDASGEVHGLAEEPASNAGQPQRSKTRSESMKMPAAIVIAVLVWSSAKYLPTYFVEMRKVDLLEERMQLDAAKQLAQLNELRSSLQSQTKTTAQTPAAVDKRFY